MTITHESVKSFVRICQFGSETVIALKKSAQNDHHSDITLIDGETKIGALSHSLREVDLTDLTIHELKIASLNCKFNGFQTLDFAHYFRFVLDNFEKEQCVAVCLQDYPYKYVHNFTCIGHIAYVAYAVGQNGDLICNCIILNPRFVSHEMMENVSVYYDSEVKATSESFIAGCFVLCLPKCNINIGSVYDSFVSSSYFRDINWKNRSRFLQNLECNTGNLSVAIGDFNPRTRLKITNERPLFQSKWKWLETFVYYLRLIALLVVSYFQIATPRDELDTMAKYNIYCIRISTMKNIQIGMFTLPFDTMKFVVDAVQTNKSFILGIKRSTYYTPSDHYGIVVTLVK